MLNPIIILSLLFIADRRRHRESSAVGYADSIVPGATTRVFRSAKDAVDFAADADMAGGTFQGEIEIVQDGYSISDDLAELAEVSTFETTKGGLRRALSALKKKDGAIIYTANPRRLYTRWTSNAVLRWFDENYSPEQPGVRGNDETAYYYTLYLIATGNKFHWDNKTTANGRTTLYGIESSLFGRKSPGEKKAYRAILTKRGEKGIYPEQLAEYISRATDSDEIVLSGVLDALREAQTPAMALGILTHVLVEQNKVDLPDEEFERFESLEFEPLPAPTYLDFNNEEVPF